MKNTKWIWEEKWPGYIRWATLHKDGTETEYKQARCLSIPGYEIKICEYPVGIFSLRMRRLNVLNFSDKQIFQINLPPSVKTLKSAQRQAPSLVKKEVTKILQAQVAKYQNILDQL